MSVLGADPPALSASALPKREVQAIAAAVIRFDAIGPDPACSACDELPAEIEMHGYAEGEALLLLCSR